jgi:hypothetical protein
MLRSNFRAFVPRCGGRPVRGLRRRARRDCRHRSSRLHRRIQYRRQTDFRPHARRGARPRDRQHLIPERFREAYHCGLRRYLETGEAHVLGKRIEVAALHASGQEFPVELAIVRIPKSDPPLFTADDDFEQMARSLRFAPGDGLPGRVWKSPSSLPYGFGTFVASFFVAPGAVVR